MSRKTVMLARSKCIALLGDARGLSTRTVSVCAISCAIALTNETEPSSA